MSTNAGAATHLAANVMHFARLLREAGLPAGTDRIMLTQQALQVAGLRSRQEFHAVLCACLLDRREHQELFDEAFKLFWQPLDLWQMASSRLQALSSVTAQDRTDHPMEYPSNPAHVRLQEAMNRLQQAAHPQPAAPQVLEVQVTFQASASERLKKLDFRSMSVEEVRAARQHLWRLHIAFQALATRRHAPSRTPGRADLRATLRAAGRQAAQAPTLRWSAPTRTLPPLVVLADISGSMSAYSRMLLHFAHVIGQRRDRHMPRVESFVFGTRLTRITPWLRQRDPDRALSRVSAGVPDWAGGTRIAECLHDFNQHWARRVLGSRATVLLVTDGLERGDSQLLTFEMDRLHKSCHRLLWLNPLLRFQGFEPRAAGIRAMRPHVDGFLPIHNLVSLEQLVDSLVAHSRLDAT